MEYMDEKILKQREALEEFEKQRFSEETIKEENKDKLDAVEIEGGYVGA